MIRNHPLFAFLALSCGHLVAAPPTPNITGAHRPGDHLFLDTGTVKVGLDRAKGASITWLSWAAHPRNIVNHADPGRLVQQSYYAGRSLDRKADGQNPSWSPWPWNPIQGGGVGSWARVTQLKRLDDGTVFGETIPKLWDMPDEEAEAVLRQWSALEPDMPNVVALRCEFVSRRQENDRWGAARPSPQEIPACYFSRKFDRFRSYVGDGKWREETQPPGPPWGKAEPPRKAMACFDPNGQGVAIFSPAATQPWNFGPHGAGASDDPAVGPCVHIAPLDRVSMGPRTTYRYRYWLIVGTETQIAARLESLWQQYAAEKAEIITPKTPSAAP